MMLKFNTIYLHQKFGTTTKRNLKIKKLVYGKQNCLMISNKGCLLEVEQFSLNFNMKIVLEFFNVLTIH